MDRIWDFGDSKEYPIHRIHSYPARFPAFITTKALQYAEQNGVEVKTVADIFCGCGTTAVEAKRKGKNFWGCDINPVATLIAQVKTTHYRDVVLERYFSAVKDSFHSVSMTEKDYEKVNDRIKYWFEEKNIESLLKLKKAIELEISNRSRYRKFFLCAFSNILKPTSRWLTKSIKAQVDPNKPVRDVMESFEDQFKLMRKANAVNIFPPQCNKVRIVRGNFLSISPEKPLADLIVTSPPYVISYDYASIHQLSLLWLGFARDYRDLRKNMIGNQDGVRTPSRSDIERLPEIGSKTYRKLLQTHSRKAASVARYFIDIKKTVTKCQDILNSNGMVLFVMGNTKYRNTEIDNAGYLVECMEKTGFHDIKKMTRKISSKIMTPYRDSRGRFTRDSTKRKVYNEEFIVTGRKK
ncbi:MAG: DNA methyltransferase [Candidatus Dadabacteria bacterium]|nr:DNA methyltransferase [Candidatus Dadabacteria bacterium]